MTGYVKAVKIVKVELGTIEVVHSIKNSVNGDYVYDELCEKGKTLFVIFGSKFVCPDRHNSELSLLVREVCSSLFAKS